MHVIPDLLEDGRTVQSREDGRFYSADFTVTAQWYYPETFYLPFVLVRPPEEKISSHPHRIAFINLLRQDFELVDGFQDVGFLRSHLIDEIVSSRMRLSLQVTTLIQQANSIGGKYNDIRHCERGMTFAVIALEHAPQSWWKTLLTFTTFQRYYLESQALFDYFRQWEYAPIISSPAWIEPDATIMGAITYDPEVASRFYSMRIPVWLVRPPNMVPLSTIIRNVIEPSFPPTMVKAILTDSTITWRGDSCAARNRACQSLRAAQIPVAHSAALPPPQLQLQQPADASM